MLTKIMSVSKLNCFFQDAKLLSVYCFHNLH